MKYIYLALLFFFTTNDLFSTSLFIDDHLVPWKNLTSPSVQFITQKEFCVVSAEDEKNIVATFGVADCVAIGIYDPVTKKASLAHCDAMTSPIKTVCMMLYQTCGDTKDHKDTKVYLFSKDLEQISRFHKQLNFLSVPDNAFTIIHARNSTFISYDVGINAKSGTFFSYEFNHKMHQDETLGKRMMFCSNNIFYDGLKIIRNK